MAEVRALPAAALATLLPDANDRADFLEFVAAVIQRAHRENEQNWSFTLGRRLIRLNQGRTLLLDLNAEGMCNVIVTPTAVPPSVQATLAPAVMRERPFKAIPSLSYWRLSLRDLLAHREDLLPLLLESVPVAAKSTSTAIWGRYHSDALVAAISAATGVDLPRPRLRAVSAPLEFEPVFAQFIEEHLGSAEGARHRATYSRLRETAAANWRAVIEAHGRGDDVTDRVLDTLLPHADTQPNRARGAWVHVAPAITKDIRPWFENGGWTRREDWPKVAEAIRAFVERALASPEAIEAHCRAFAANPVTKGLQSGFLSPILNALAPERFPLVNSKSLRMLRAFTGQRYAARIEEYPRVARALGSFADTQTALILPVSRDAPITDILDQFAHWFVTAFDADDEQTEIARAIVEAPAYWKIAPGEDAKLWEMCRTTGCIAVGWRELGDVGAIDRATFEARVAATGGRYSDYAAERIWEFSRIELGTVIVANRGTQTALGFGRVVGPYQFIAESEYPHRLPVEWIDVRSRRIDESGWRMTFVRLDRARVERLLAAPLREGAPPTEEEEEEDVSPPVGRHPPYPIDALAQDTRFDARELEGMLASIRRKGQALLAGPPGTGKTFLADHLARHLVADGDGIVETVQFHPAYSYEDFVQGLRPIASEGAMRLDLLPGCLLDFLKRASRTPAPSVLIFDEINRANVSRVFGELMHAIEYRGRAVRLAAGGTLTVPKSVYFLGTMNTADRSIALVDHALRRRFAYLRLGPRYDVLQKWLGEKGLRHDGLISVLKHVNASLNDPGYEVGVSFFLRDDLPDTIEAVWCEEVIPYIEEFFFDQPKRVEAFRWENVRDQLALR